MGRAAGPGQSRAGPFLALHGCHRLAADRPGLSARVGYRRAMAASDSDIVGSVSQRVGGRNWLPASGYSTCRESL